MISSLQRYVDGEVRRLSRGDNLNLKR